jgi:hypothetical protein
VPLSHFGFVGLGNKLACFWGREDSIGHPLFFPLYSFTKHNASAQAQPCLVLLCCHLHTLSFHLTWSGTSHWVFFVYGQLDCILHISQATSLCFSSKARREPIYIVSRVFIRLLIHPLLAHIYLDQ